MTSDWKRFLGAASLLAFLAGTSSAFSQAERTWVDPPSDSETATKAPTAPSPQPSAPPSPSAPESSTASAPLMTPAPATERAEAGPPSETQKQATKAKSQSQRKATAERKAKKRPSKAIASTRMKAPASSRREAVAERRSRGSIRSARVRDAVNSGLEVMSLRTIEFPDGRRIEVLVRPSPGTVSRLMDEDYEPY